MLTKRNGVFTYSSGRLFLFAAICSQLITSCINDISEDVPESGDIPISLFTSSKDISGSTATPFEENDAIGVFIMVQPSTIDKTRYIDNMKFNNSSTGFTPQETIFFPEGNNKCDFISYYPYQKNAINKGESNIKVEVKTDQSNKEALSTSDFMIATGSGIKPSENPVELTFEHKLFCMNIQLKATSGYTLDMLLDANPTIKIKDVYTKANYNLNTHKFTDFSEKADIIPFGSWSIEDEMLCGKSAIIIPQTLPQSHIIIELYIDGRLFECKLEEERTFISGIAEDNTISLLSSNDATRAIITACISNWTYQENSMTANEAGRVIQTSKLDFTDSNVLKVMNKEKQVAEICLEYLCTDELDSQAIVIYPTTNGKTDLSKGMVLELIDEPENKHGGNVTWNKTNNTLIYTEGTSTAIDYIYIDTEGEIKTSRPASAMQLQVKPDILIDNRGDETVRYPIVKIGTQYWMRINFRATRYTDGIAIDYGGSTTNGVTVKTDLAQYYERDNAYFFYNTSCIANGDLVPYGWRIGSENDYSHLKTYIKDNASVLKNGSTWRNNTYGISNLSGFNAVATGYLNKTYTGSRDYAAYWCNNNDSPNTVGKIVTLNVNDNKVTIGNATKDMAIVVKCIRN